MRNPLHHPRLALARPGLLCLSLFCGSIAQSQIAAWEFNTAAGNEATIAATTLNANLNATNVSRGAGLNVSALGNAFSATDFTAAGTPAQAITNNDYLQ